MGDIAFAHLAISHLTEGLRAGLSHYSQQSRVALIYALGPGDTPRIHDPHGLLEGHEPKLEEMYLKSSDWRTGGQSARRLPTSELFDCHTPQFAGLVSFGCRSQPIHHQLWLTEHHPDVCCTGPTERWLECAASLLTQDMAARHPFRLSISAYALATYSIHALRDHIVDERSRILGMDTRLRVFPTLDLLLSLSRTREEGSFPRGRLTMIDPGVIDRVDYLARFPEDERPLLANLKHVRKLLTSVQDSELALVGDGRTILGIVAGTPPPGSITGDFRGQHGFLLLDDTPVASFFDGAFHSTTRKAKLDQLEEALLESDLDPDTRHALFRIVQRMVHAAQDAEHGCTLVVDMAETPRAIPGSMLETPLELARAEPNHAVNALALAPDERSLRLAAAFSRLDGALHIGRDLRLHRYSCLLDGLAVPGENRARGARFNSALRFTAGRRDVLVVVVSADRPVSVIQDGVELAARCETDLDQGRPWASPTLASWLRKGENGRAVDVAG